MDKINNESKAVYGPFTPQETDRIATALQQKSIPFEIHKDEDDEKKFTRSDFQSIVTRAEYRTETYLAQIFYFSISELDQMKFQESLKELNLAPQETGEAPGNLETALPAEEQKRITADANSKNQQKRFIASLLVALILLGILYSFANTLTKILN